MIIIDDFKKPIHLIPLAITIISIAISIVLYFKSNKEMIPTYMVSSSQYKIYDSKTSSSGMTLIDAAKRPITEDVYLVETVFWNSGQLPIEPENVRIPVRINVSECSQILEVKIVKQTKPEVAKFRIVYDTSRSNSLNEKSLLLAWDHLDPKFGARIQIIYAGKPTSKLFYSGYITGIDNFLVGTQDDNPTLIQKILTFIFGVLLFFLGYDFILLVYRLIRHLIKKPIKEFNYRDMVVEVFLIVLIFIFIRYVFVSVVPPV
jgi:hypothetical protein